MKNLNLKIYVSLILFCILLSFTNCTEDQVFPEHDDTIIESRGGFGPAKEPKDPSPIDIIFPSIPNTVYVRWHPTVLDARKAEIRAIYSDVNGYMYLVSYSTCPNDPNIEIWQVTFGAFVPGMGDQTPDPLGSIPDEEGEMDKPTRENICSQVDIISRK